MQPLHTLLYEDQLLRFQQLVEATLPRYGLRAVQSTLLQHENNAVYDLTTPAGERFVLRISSTAGRSAAEQRSEMQWLTALRHDTDLVVPEPIPNVDGDLVTAVAGTGAQESHQIVLFRRVPGEPPAPGIERAAVERIGALTAKLHRHAEHFAPPAGFARPRWDWERLFGAPSVLRSEEAMALLASPEREVLTAAGLAVRRALDLPGKEALAQGLIHADLHQGNILLHDGEAGVIDFDDCGWGYFVFDVASVLDSFYRRVASEPDDYPRLREAYLRGYERVRALPAEIEAHLRTFKAMRDMVNIDFILGSKNANVVAWGRERLGHFIAQLEAYLGGSPSLGI